MGDVVSTIENVLGTGISIADDPYFPETICHIQQLTQIQNGQAVQACTDTPDNIAGGVGLANFVKPLRAYVWLEENKWGYALLAAGVIGLPFLLGYEAGKGG